MKNINCWHGKTRVFEEHTEILNATKNKDSKDAHKRMYEHLTGVKRDLL